MYWWDMCANDMDWQRIVLDRCAYLMCACKRKRSDCCAGYFAMHTRSYHFATTGCIRLRLRWRIRIRWKCFHIFGEFYRTVKKMWNQYHENWSNNFVVYLSNTSSVIIYSKIIPGKKSLHTTRVGKPITNVPMHSYLHLPFTSVVSGRQNTCLHMCSARSNYRSVQHMIYLPRYAYTYGYSAYVPMWTHIEVA